MLAVPIKMYYIFYEYNLKKFLKVAALKLNGIIIYSYIKIPSVPVLCFYIKNLNLLNYIEIRAITI